MSATVVRYRTKPDKGDENQALIEKVFQDLKATQPAGLRYTSFRLADGVSFVHIAIVDTADGANPLTAVHRLPGVHARYRRVVATSRPSRAPRPRSVTTTPVRDEMSSQAQTAEADSTRPEPCRLARATEVGAA